MRLGNEAFWALTPRQFGLLLDRDRERRKSADRRAGEIVATLFNVHVDRTKNPKGITWLDVFPEHREPVQPQTDDQMYHAMMAWTKATEPKH